MAALVFVLYSGMNSDSIFNVLASNSSASRSTVITGEIAAGYGDASGIADGVYMGIGTGFRGEMKIKVTVESQQITTIEVTETKDDVKWFDRAYNSITANIIKNQTAEVNSVSGATYSSIDIKEGVANALINAGGKNVNAIENNLPAPSEQQHGGKGRKGLRSEQ